MKTPAISNTVNIPTGSTPAAKASDATSDMPFGQVLSREMSARTKPDDAPKAKSDEGVKANQSNRSDAKSNNAKSADAAEANTPEETAPPSAAVKQNATADAGKVATKTDNADSEEDATLSPASAELLALVASLTQQAAGATAASDDAVAATDSDAKDAETAVAADMTAAEQGLNPQITAQLAALANPSAPAQGAEDETAGQVAEALLPAANSSNGSRPSIMTGVERTTASSNNGKEASIAAAGAGEHQEIASDAAGVTQDAAAKAVSARQTKGRTEQEPALRDVAASDAKRTEAEPAQGKADRSLSAFTLPKAASETASAKASQDIQQPVATPFNVAVGPASPTQVQRTQPASSKLSDTLAPQVGSPGWDQALGQKVVWMVSGEQQSASLTLNPPDLGPLQIELKVANNQATANFTAGQQEVRQALEAAMPRLREMLGEAGIQLGQASVSAGMPNNQQNAFEQPQRSSGHASTNDGSDTPAPVTRTQTVTSRQGLVDTFV